MTSVAGKADYVAKQRHAAHDGTHTCHATGCSRSVHPAMFMCGRHWRMVPSAQRTAIWQHYRPGQEIDKAATAAYLAAAKAAIDAVAYAERRS